MGVVLFLITHGHVGEIANQYGANNKSRFMCVSNLSLITPNPSHSLSFFSLFKSGISASDVAGVS